MAVTPSLLIIFVVTNVFGVSESTSIDCLTQAPFFMGSVFAALDPNTPDTIRAICEDFSNSTEMALGTKDSVAQIKYDPLYKLVYWADWDANTINRGHTPNNNSDATPCFTEVVMNDTKNGILDIDAVNRKLYWGSNSDYLIGVADLDGSNSSVLYNKTSGAYNVVDIRVDSVEGLIFWGTTTSTGQVVKGTISGGNHTVLRSNVQVECIEINAKAGILYWISSPATIQSSSYNGDNFDADFITIDVNTGAPDMVLYDGYFYVTTLNIGTGFEIKLYRVQESKGATATLIEISTPLQYLFAEPGIIPPLDTIISLNQSKFNAAEGEILTIPIKRTGNLFGCSSITIETRPDSARQAEDYSHINTTVQFSALSSGETIQIEILADDEIERDETFLVVMSNPSNGVLGDEVEATIFIQGPPSPAKTLSTEAIVGIAIGAILVVVFLIIIIVVIYAYRKSKSGKGQISNDHVDEEMKEQNKPLQD